MWTLLFAASAGAIACIAEHASSTELAASTLVSWLVLWLLTGDQPQPARPFSTARRLAAAALWLAALGAAAIALHLTPVPRIAGETAVERFNREEVALFSIRLLQLFAGAALFAVRAARLSRPAPLAALLVPLFTPTPQPLRDGLDLGSCSAWGAEHLLRALGTQVVRDGPLLTGAHSSLVVNSHCSGLGAILQMLALCLLLGLVTGKPARRVAPLALAPAPLGLVLNFIRIAFLFHLVAIDHDRFVFWHTQSGAHLYNLGSVALFLLVALPALGLVRLRPPPRAAAA